jgi:hypothetical protein
VRKLNPHSDSTQLTAICANARLAWRHGSTQSVAEGVAKGMEYQLFATGLAAGMGGTPGGLLLD